MRYAANLLIFWSHRSNFFFFSEHEAPGLERRILIDTVDKDDIDDTEEESANQVCYFIVAGNELGYFYLEPLRHELVVEQELDREEYDQHVLLVKATEDCLHTPANESFFDENDDTLLKVIVKVNDINDHPPKFVKRVFTGGVTTSADFGTEFMRVKVSILIFFFNPGFAHLKRF